jgi:hypothetical protein
MKKILLVMGMVLAVTLICGCAGQEESAANEEQSVNLDGVAEVQKEADINPNVDGGLTGNGDMPAEEDDILNTSAENSSSGAVTLSQEDLDRLKEDLEKLEFEDLGGLSGE